MKKIIYTLFVALMVASTAHAQIDRSIQPKQGPAPKINLGKPKSFTLPNGLTVLVVENHKLPRVSFTLTLDNPPVAEGNLAGIADITGSMMGNGTSSMSKDDFNEKIEFYGANVNFGVTGVGGTTLSRYFPEVFSLAIQGALDPLFTQEELEKEKAKYIDGLKTNEKSASFIAGQVSDALAFGKDHPFGEITTEATINNITLADVTGFYAKNFSPENAYLVVVGDVKFEDVEKLVKKDFASWKKTAVVKNAYREPLSFSEPLNLPNVQIDFVDVPSAVQSEIKVLNITHLKMTDPDYYAALLADMILGGGSDGYLFKNLRESHGWTYGSYSSISGGKYVSTFSATASVRNAVTDSAVVEILNEVKRIATELPSAATLAQAKAKYVGNFVMNAEKPQTVASFALREKTQSLPADFYENYIRNINNVTLEQVQAAAAKYFQYNNVRIVIVGKAADVLPKLETLNIPINYYDREANPVGKPQQAAIDASITAQTILMDYINAVGGKKNLEEVTSIVIESQGSVQGQTVTIIQKSTADGKAIQEINVMGMTLSKVVFDGQKGYVTIQGNQKELGVDEVAEMKYSVPFPELLYLNSDIKLVGMEGNSYVLSIGGKSLFYDKDSHFKVAEVVTTAQGPDGNPISQKVEFADYQPVNNVKIPYITRMNMGIEIEMAVTAVKINESVIDADFQ